MKAENDIATLRLFAKLINAVSDRISVPVATVYADSCIGDHLNALRKIEMKLMSQAEVVAHRVKYGEPLEMTVAAEMYEDSPSGYR